MMDHDQSITVMQVFWCLGIHCPDPKISWSVGAQIANAYRKEHGEDPPKDNRPKTNGQGSHCFALYPPAWRAQIERVITETVDYDQRQGDLF